MSEKVEKSSVHVKWYIYIYIYQINLPLHSFNNSQLHQCWNCYRSNLECGRFELWSDQTKDWNWYCCFSTKHYGVRSKTGWIVIRIMCPSGATFISTKTLLFYCDIILIIHCKAYIFLNYIWSLVRSVYLLVDFYSTSKVLLVGKKVNF